MILNLQDAIAISGLMLLVTGPLIGSLWYSINRRIGRVEDKLDALHGNGINAIRDRVTKLETRVGE